MGIGKRILGLGALNILLHVVAAVREGAVYLPNSGYTGQEISSKGLQLLLAQQLGVENHYRVGDAEDDVLELLNAHASSRETGGRIVVVDHVQNVCNEMGTTWKTWDPLTADILPSRTSLPWTLSSETRFWFEGLTSQLQNDHVCSFGLAIIPGLSGVISGNEPLFCRQLDQQKPILKTISDLAAFFSGLEICYSVLIHIKTLQNVETYDQTVREIKTLIQSLGPDTIVAMPATSDSLRKRQIQPHKEVVPQSAVNASRLATSSSSSTAGIETTAAASKSGISSAHTSSISSTYTSSSTSFSALPTGVIPACHADADLAFSATNNCSGHGSVFKKSSGRSSGGAKAIDCYACRCTATSIKHDDGTTKTIQWGGAACQKKDLSMPFFLLGGITLGLVSVIGFGISLLVQLGQEDLPSVIGAGVAGPRTK